MPAFAAMAFLLTVVLQYQNCSGVSFTNNPAPTMTGAVSSAPDTQSDSDDPGLSGGHFDLDTSTAIYPLGKGTTDHHVHEYDDKYNVTYADFLNLLDAKFSQIDQAISATSRFQILIANASLSPGAVIEINGIQTSALKYNGLTTVYTLGVPGAGEVQLKSFSVRFAKDALLTGGLIATATGCVRANNAGLLGEYRNGALIVQALAAGASTIDPVTRVASSGLLWESTLFWHRDGNCYGK
jgi:hypothetical protein